MIWSLPGPDKGQREPGWMVSMTGCRRGSALESESLLPGLVLSTVSQSRPWGKTWRGPGTRQIPARPSSLRFLSPDPTFLPRPPAIPATGSEASYSQDGVHFPSVTHSPWGTTLPLARPISIDKAVGKDRRATLGAQ